MKTMLFVGSTVLLASAAAPAHAFLFGKKEQVTCAVFGEPRGAGGQPQRVAPALLKNGAASIAATANIYVGRTVYMRGAKIAGTVTTDSQGRRVLAVTFRDPKGAVFKTDRALLRSGYWTTIAWDAWPKSQAHLDIQCMIEKAK